MAAKPHRKTSRATQAQALLPANQPPAVSPVVCDRSRWLVPLLLLAATLASYLPCLNGDFIWDDGAWTTKSEYYLRDLRGLWEIWTNPTAMQQYFPVTATSFWLDWHFWREWTLPYHLENVLLHVTAAILFWRLLSRLAVPGAVLAAFIFALHPAMVESVAWITERKNVLSLVFMLLSMLSYPYLVSSSTEQQEQRGHRLRYTLSLLLFTAALLAKITAFVLPPIFLLIAWWNNNRLRWKKDVLPALPFFAIAFALGLLVHWLEKHHVGADGTDFSMSLAQRTVLAGRIFWFYPLQLLWPADMRLFYPKWHIDTTAPTAWLFTAAAFFTLFLLWKARHYPAIRAMFVAVLVYLIGISPVLGFLNVYGMFISDVADRWVHVPALGLIALAAAGLTRWLSRRWLTWLALPVLAALTWRHAGHYATEEGFWRAAIVHNPEAWIAHNNLGTILARKRCHDEATTHLQRAIELRPGYAEAWCNQANLLRETGRIDEALTSYHQALRLRPDDYPDAHNNLGLTLLLNGRPTDASFHFSKAIEIQPQHVLAHNNLGNYFLQSGRPTDAIASYQHALDIDPAYADAHNNIGMALLQQGMPAEAMVSIEKAIALRPGYAEALNNLGHALMQLHQPREALKHFSAAVQARPGYAQAHHNAGIAHYLLAEVDQTIASYEQAIQADPNLVSSMNNLAWILATYPDDRLRDGKKALLLAKQVNTLTGDRDATVLHTLAATLAENGRFDEAVQTARRSLDLANTQNNTALAAAVRDQLSRYESHQPFRDVAPDAKAR
jgi:tetratricopeptide (TPR) repeat protein